MTGIKTFVSVCSFAALLIVVVPLRPQSAAQSGQETPSGAAPASPSPDQSAPATAPAPAQTAPPQSAPAPAAQTPPPAAATPTAVLDPSTMAWKMLTDSINSDKYPTRSDALAALVVLGTDRRAVRLMIKALDDKEALIRAQAASSLGEVKARAAIPALRATLEDKEPQVAFAAAQALWGMGDHSGREIFYEVLDGERKAQPGLIKGNIAKAKAEMHDPKGLILIGINETSVALLGPGALGVTAVEEMATNKSAPAQTISAKLLGEDDEKETVDELKMALNDKSGVVREAAARALAKLNQPEAIIDLVNMMQNDKNQGARFIAAAAVIHLDQPKTPAKVAVAPPVAPQLTPRAKPKQAPAPLQTPSPASAPAAASPSAPPAAH